MSTLSEYGFAERMNSAMLLHARGFLSEAIRAYRLLLDVQSGHGEINHLLRIAESRFEEQKNLPEQMRQRPDSAESYCSMGSALLDIGNLEKAEKCFLKALEIMPTCFPAYLGLGWIFFVRLDLDSAEKCWKLSYQYGPDHADALVNLAMVMISRGLPDQAIPILHAVLSKTPKHTQAGEQLVKANALMTIGRDQYEVLYACGHVSQAESVARDLWAKEPTLEHHNRILMCCLASPSHSAQDYFDETRAWSLKHGREDFLPLPEDFKNSRRPDKRLKVGIVGDYFVGVIGLYTLVPFFRSYDREQIEFYCYNFGPGREMLEPIVDHYRDVTGLSQQQFYEGIKSDGIDIMLDINGRLRTPSFFEALIRQPAPIIVNWYNLTATVGHKAYNYLIADDYSVRPEDEPLYTEKVIRMPTGTISSWDMGSPPRVSGLPKKKNGFVTFGSFANFFKVNELVLSSWAELLGTIPDARLYLKSRNLCLAEERSRVSGYFQQRGISPDRLILEGESPLQLMQKRYELVDIALDTFPYSSGSSTIHALWHGVPVLAIAGASWRERNSASILAGASLDKLIAADVSEYLSKALQLAGDDEALTDYRTHLGEYLVTTPQWQTRDFARNFESRLRMIWLDWLAGANQERQ